MKAPIGVLMINFGEPARMDRETVIPFLERIFLQNAGLERHPDGAARARELAERRAPSLIEEYRAIGGSPLNDQAEEHARALESALLSHGREAVVAQAFQFTRPFITDALAELQGAGVERFVALPVYPLCGHSTTVAALNAVRDAVAEADWDATSWVGLSGWHHHPDYVEVRARGIRRFCLEEGLDPSEPDTILYFSAHGTPIKYLEEGSRYDRYVEEHCARIARAVGVERWAVGFQNHTNRRIAWTSPDNEDRIEGLVERRLVVEAVSFMHEQSETLYELDRDVREFVEGLGKEFHRVPVPHADPAFIDFLRMLVEAALDRPGASGSILAPCRCCPARGTFCTNGARDLPPSPYGPEAEPVGAGRSTSGASA